MTAPGLFAASADLTLTLKGVPSPTVVGGNLTLTYALTNKGPDLATSIGMTNVIPPRVIVKSLTVSNGSSSLTNGVFYWSLDNLDVDAWATAQLVVAPVNTQAVTNRASVVAATSDPQPNNNLNRYVTVTVKPLAPGANLALPRFDHAATLLKDGRVLLTGGSSSTSVTRTAEIYDPAPQVFLLTGEMRQPRIEHTATLLPDGTVLVVGGDTGSGRTTAVDLYCPTGGVFAAANSLALARARHTATLLPDGRVLIAGGAAGNNAFELYDCALGALSLAGNSVIERSGHSAALLPNGKVLLVGGAGSAMLTAEVYDPQTMLSHSLPGLPANFYAPVATSMCDGRVLVYGRYGTVCFNPETEQFTSTGLPLSGRSNPRLTLVNDCRLLLSGGIDGLGYVATTEIYDPASTAFAPGSPMTIARYRHSATLLQDGRVLLAGGYAGSILASSEIYALTVDLDLDGMSDEWELKHALDPSDRDDAILDPDNDGLNNLQEYLAGTDPRDANSVMRIDTCQINPTAFRVRFNTVQGKSYRLERTSDSLGGSWCTVSNYIVGTGAFVEIADTLIPEDNQKLYRVRLLQ